MGSLILIAFSRLEISTSDPVAFFCFYFSTHLPEYADKITHGLVLPGQQKIDIF